MPTKPDRRGILIYAWCDGTDVDELIEHSYVPGRTYYPETRLAHLEHVILGLGYLHDKGIVHRDLKSGNVLVDNRQEGSVAVIGDFGSAKFFEHKLTGIKQHAVKSKTGLALGTPGYFRPTAGTKATRQLDGFSLGVIILEMLTGLMPVVYDVDEESGAESGAESDDKSNDKSKDESTKAMMERLRFKDVLCDKDGYVAHKYLYLSLIHI